MSFDKTIWWARDGASILRQNGSAEHANAVVAVCDRLSAIEAELAEARKDGERFRFQFDPANLKAMTDIELEALQGNEPHNLDWWREKIDAARKEGV